MTKMYSGLLLHYLIKAYPGCKAFQMLYSFFVVKNLPIADISAQSLFFSYDIDTTTNKNTTRR